MVVSDTVNPDQTRRRSLVVVVTSARTALVDEATVTGLLAMTVRDAASVSEINAHPDRVIELPELVRPSMNPPSGGNGAGADEVVLTASGRRIEVLGFGSAQPEVLMVATQMAVAMASRRTRNSIPFDQRGWCVNVPRAARRTRTVRP